MKHINEAIAVVSGKLVSYKVWQVWRQVVKVAAGIVYWPLSEIYEMLTGSW